MQAIVNIVFLSCYYVILSTNKGEQIECYLVMVLTKTVSTVLYIKIKPTYCELWFFKAFILFPMIEYDLIDWFIYCV